MDAILDEVPRVEAPPLSVVAARARVHTMPGHTQQRADRLGYGGWQTRSAQPSSEGSAGAFPYRFEEIEPLWAVYPAAHQPVHPAGGISERRASLLRSFARRQAASAVGGMETVGLRTPGVPPTRTDTDHASRHAATSKRRSSSYASMLGLRNEKVTALLVTPAGGSRPAGVGAARVPQCPPSSAGRAAPTAPFFRRSEVEPEALNRMWNQCLRLSTNLARRIQELDNPGENLL
jgi:hypothetical protein